MITSFRHKGLETFYLNGSTRGIQPAHAAELARILAALDAATEPGELSLPAFKLHPLKGRLKAYWAIWVSGNWRVTFRFRGADVELIDYLDYH
jgi:proteic killer suppression protein